MIEARHISKSFGSLQVLRQVDLDIPDRRVTTIVGSSGAGKTTLLQILGTLMKPDEGTVTLGGTDIRSLSDRQLAAFRNRQIGFVFQFHHLLPEFTALENVCMPALIGGTRRAEAERQAKEMLDFLGLSERLYHHPDALSGGEQQRVAVARALINHPQVVFADEPSGNLDTVNKQALHRLFFKLRDTFGQTFVVVTHDMQLAAMSDICYTMHDGRIVEKNVPGEPGQLS
ncbi:MAG: ABC transporter ATP-binding protein [Bacteroidales bacterium]|nr:ABC transporter ATP-binding protein [Bacteroidales bacterium]